MSALKPAQVTLKILNKSDNGGFSATRIFLMWSRDTWHPVFPYQTIFLLPYVHC